MAIEAVSDDYNDTNETGAPQAPLQPVVQHTAPLLTRMCKLLQQRTLLTIPGSADASELVRENTPLDPSESDVLNLTDISAGSSVLYWNANLSEFANAPDAPPQNASGSVEGGPLIIKGQLQATFGAAKHSQYLHSSCKAMACCKLYVVAPCPGRIAALRQHMLAWPFHELL